MLSNCYLCYVYVPIIFRAELTWTFFLTVSHLMRNFLLLGRVYMYELRFNSCKPLLYTIHFPRDFILMQFTNMRK